MKSDTNYNSSVLHELLRVGESEWVEFKHNKIRDDDLGEYISALSNSAALHQKAKAYIVWGIRDSDHEIIGTTFSPHEAKVGNQELESWLLNLLSPRIHFRFHLLSTDRATIVLLEITPASHTPVKFKNEEYIRVGSYKKKLKDYPETERQLWRILDKETFEEGIAKENISSDAVVNHLNYPIYFELLDLPLPTDKKAIIKALESDNLIVKAESGLWNITNLGAVLFAKNLQDFNKLQRKSVRVIFYKGVNRIETLREQEGKKGYATGFEGLIEFIINNTPQNEVMGQALRKTVPMFPELAVRELVANALIHQDFNSTGTNPMIEIFTDRIEITNPGLPLIETRRFLDSPPKSRNEKLASLMRRVGVCEERGSGIDKVEAETEKYQLPSPLFETPNGFTKATLFAYKQFDEMSKEHKVRSCYMHCVSRYLSRNNMDNASLRERFKLSPDKASNVTRVIKWTMEVGLVVDASVTESRKYKTYVPYWIIMENL